MYRTRDVFIIEIKIFNRQVPIGNDIKGLKVIKKTVHVIVLEEIENKNQNKSVKILPYQFWLANSQFGIR